MITRRPPAVCVISALTSRQSPHQGVFEVFCMRSDEIVLVLELMRVITRNGRTRTFSGLQFILFSILSYLSRINEQMKESVHQQNSVVLYAARVQENRLKMKATVQHPQTKTDLGQTNFRQSKPKFKFEFLPLTSGGPLNE